jgi:hypothetical protein
VRPFASLDGTHAVHMTLVHMTLVQPVPLSATHLMQYYHSELDIKHKKWLMRSSPGISIYYSDVEKSEYLSNTDYRDCQR